MKTLRQEKGMVLLLVLVIVALLASLLTEFAFSTLVDLRLAETFRNSTGAYYLSKGGIQVGRMILQEDTNEYDAPVEVWGQGVANYPVNDGVVSIAIKDLDGRLDINRLVSTAGNPNVPQMDRFVRLFEILEIDNPQALTDSLIDWIDKDEEPRNLGAESEYYQGLDKPYPCKNAPLDSLDELNLVQGFSPEVIELVKPHVTSHGSKTININTATAEVLQALPDQTAEPGTVESIISRRERSPFKKLDDLKEEFEDWYFAVSGVADTVAVKSANYSIESWAGLHSGARSVKAVVHKSGNKLLYLKVN